MQRHLFVISGVELDVIGGRPTIRGECDLSNATEMAGWRSSFGRTSIEVDLSGVTFIDAAALQAVLAAAQRNPNLRVAEPTTVVQRVLQITDTYSLLVERDPADHSSNR